MFAVLLCSRKVLALGDNLQVLVLVLGKSFENCQGLRILQTVCYVAHHVMSINSVTAIVMSIR